MIIPAPNVGCDAKTHREMVLTRRYLYEDIKKFAEVIESSVTAVNRFEKFNYPVSRTFFVDYSDMLETVADENYFKVFKQARLRHDLTQEYIGLLLKTSSSTISKFERGLITPSNLFIISYGMIVGLKVYAKMSQQLCLAECDPTVHNLPLVEYLEFVNNL